MFELQIAPRLRGSLFDDCCGLVGLPRRVTVERRGARRPRYVPPMCCCRPSPIEGRSLRENGLDVSSVSKAFGTGASARHVLEDVTLTVDEGEFVSIVGFMGCGKSTFINILCGLVRPDSGINSPKDLNGKRIGTSAIASVMHVADLHWLKANGADPASIVPVEVPFTGMMDQLKAGRVDAVELCSRSSGRCWRPAINRSATRCCRSVTPSCFHSGWRKRLGQGHRAVIKKWIVSSSNGDDQGDDRWHARCWRSIPAFLPQSSRGSLSGLSVLDQPGQLRSGRTSSSRRASP